MNQIDDIQAGVAKAVRELLQDGTEFRAVVNVMRVMAQRNKGIMFEKVDVWHVAQVNGFRILTEAGDPVTFDSFAELCRWLLFDALDYRDPT